MDNKENNLYKMNAECEQLLWKDCIFVFDSSALLSFYAMPAQTRQKIYDSLILPNIQKFWIPGHVKFEYLKNREKVIRKPISESYEKLKNEALTPIEKLVNDLKTKTDDLAKRILRSEKHPHFDDVEVKAFALQLETLKTAHDTFKSGVEARIDSAKKEISDLQNADDFLAFFAHFNIGRDFSFEEIYQITIEGKHRYEFSIPPGYEDFKNKDKVGTQIFGDLIIWKQILEFSKETNKPIVLICDDLKADWCYTYNASGDIRIEAPREELIKEFKDHSGHSFWMYNLPQFLYHANQYWAGSIEEKDIDALAEVITESEVKPVLQLELVPTGTTRRNSGYSHKNPVNTDENGNSFTLIGGQNKPIIHWDLTWEMQLRIHNQSNYTAFNIKLEQGNEKWFSSVESLPAINHLKSLSVLSLDVEYFGYIESNHLEADLLLKNRIPKDLEKLVIQVSYQNEQQKIFEVRYRIENGLLLEI